MTLDKFRGIWSWLKGEKRVEEKRCHEFVVSSSFKAVPKDFVEDEGSAPHIEGVPECFVLDVCCRRWRRYHLTKKGTY